MYNICIDRCKRTVIRENDYSDSVKQYTVMLLDLGL